MIPRRSLPLLFIAGALAMGCSKKTSPPAPSLTNALAAEPAAAPAPAPAAPASAAESVITARETGSGMATGRRQYQPLTIQKRIDKSSP